VNPKLDNKGLDNTCRPDGDLLNNIADHPGVKFICQNFSFRTSPDQGKSQDALPCSKYAFEASRSGGVVLMIFFFDLKVLETGEIAVNDIVF